MVHTGLDERALLEEMCFEFARLRGRRMLLSSDHYSMYLLGALIVLLERQVARPLVARRPVRGFMAGLFWLLLGWPVLVTRWLHRRQRA